MKDNNNGLYTLAMLVSDHAGVLQRIVGLFSRRGYNIVSLSVGPTYQKGTSRITVVTEGTTAVVRQIQNQVEKLIDVFRVIILDNETSIQSELILAKISTKDNTRSKVLEIGEIFKAKILDVTPETITFQLTGGTNKIQSFMTLVKTYGVVEMARTGLTAMERGALPLSLHPYDEDE